MTIYTLGQETPRLGEDAWVAASAHVIGRVALGDHASVWFGAVLRADNEPMTIGAASNIQDGAVLHSDPGFPLTIGQGVTIGHQVMLHGCTVGDGSLIGIGAIVLNGARIGRNCLVAAGALIPPGKAFPDGVLIVGSPAVIKRQLSDEEVASLQRTARNYVENAARYATDLAVIADLSDDTI